MDYTAIGDTTNMASRLLNIAQPGQIAVSRPTQRLTEGYFVFDDLGSFTVKGKTEPIPVWAVTGEVHGRTRLEVSLERGLTPLAGRDAERAGCLDVYRRVSESGTPAIAVLSGEPGVGKSRLLYEFMRRVGGARRAGPGGDLPLARARDAVPPDPRVAAARPPVHRGHGGDEILDGVAGRLRTLGVDERGAGAPARAPPRRHRAG